MRKRRVTFLSEMQHDQRERIRAGRHAVESPATEDDLLLARAERTVRRSLWLRKSLPLHLLLLAPGLLFIWTRSRVVLAAFIATYPLLLLLRLFFARLLSRLAEPEEILVRRAYERLRASTLEDD